MPIAYFTGGYRLLNFKNFPGEIGCGLALDFFLNVLPLLFLQGINNATLTQQAFDSGHLFKLSDLQTFCIMSKLVLMGDLILESAMFFYELYKLHHLEKQSINVVVRYSEPERRKKFAHKYACRIMPQLVFLGALFAAIQIFMDPIECYSDQAIEFYSIC